VYISQNIDNDRYECVDDILPHTLCAGLFIVCEARKGH